MDDLIEWAQVMFGNASDDLLTGDQGNNMLNDEVYSDEELREDLLKLDRRLQAHKEDIEELRSEYRDHIEAAVEADPVEREPHLKQAEIARNKAEITMKQYEKDSHMLGVILVVRALRNIVDDAGEIDTVSKVEDIPEPVYERVRSEFEDRVELHDEIEYREPREYLQAPIFDAPMLNDTGDDEETTREEELVEQITAGELSVDDVDSLTLSAESGGTADE